MHTECRRSCQVRKICRWIWVAMCVLCRDRELAYPKFWLMRTLMNVDETTQNSSHETRHIPEAARAVSFKTVRGGRRSTLDIRIRISYSFRYAGGGVLSFRSGSGRSAVADPKFPTLIEIIPRHNGSPLHRFGIFKLVLTNRRFK